MSLSFAGRNARVVKSTAKNYGGFVVFRGGGNFIVLDIMVSMS